MLNNLEDFRDRLVGIADRAALHLHACTEDGVTELVRCRTEMARVLTIYQLFVHRELFADMVASPDPARRARGAHLKAECILLTEEFRHAARRWSNADIAACWDEYQPLALAMRRRVLDHLETVTALHRQDLPRAA